MHRQHEVSSPQEQGEGSHPQSDLTCLKAFSFSAYIKTTILPKRNNNLHHGHDQLQYGEFLQWLGLWLLMSTMVGPQRHEYWAAYPIDAFRERLFAWVFGCLVRVSTQFWRHCRSLIATPSFS